MCLHWPGPARPCPGPGNSHACSVCFRTSVSVLLAISASRDYVPFVWGPRPGIVFCSFSDPCTHAGRRTPPPQLIVDLLRSPSFACSAGSVFQSRSFAALPGTLLIVIGSHFGRFSGPKGPKLDPSSFLGSPWPPLPPPMGAGQGAGVRFGRFG